MKKCSGQQNMATFVSVLLERLLVFCPYDHHAVVCLILLSWKGDINSFGGICHGVILVNNQLHGVAYEFRSFSLVHLYWHITSVQVAQFSKAPKLGARRLRLISTSTPPSSASSR